MIHRGTKVLLHRVTCTGALPRFFHSQTVTCTGALPHFFHSQTSDLHRGIATLLSFTDNAGAQDLGGSAALLTSLPLKELAFGKTGFGQHAELEGIKIKKLKLRVLL